MVLSSRIVPLYVSVCSQNNHSDQPQANDAVLGGIKGVTQRMGSVVEQRIAELSEALKYGEASLGLVIEALQDESTQV